MFKTRLDSKDIEVRKQYKSAYHTILHKYVGIIYDSESDNYLTYDSEENFIGRCSPKNLKEFN